MVSQGKNLAVNIYFISDIAENGYQFRTAEQSKTTENEVKILISLFT